MSCDGDDVQQHVPSSNAGNDRGDVSGAPDNGHEEDPFVDAADRDASSASGSENAVDEEMYGNDDDVGDVDSVEEESDDDTTEASDDDDDDSVVVSASDEVYALSVSQAAEQLRQVSDNGVGPYAIPRLKRLHVNLGTPISSVDVGRYRRDYPGHFRSFVTELERCQLIDSVNLKYANLGDREWDGRRAYPDDSGSRAYAVDADLQPNANDLDRLFGTVLPRHASLQDIRILGCQIQPLFVQLFSESVATNPLFDMGMIAFENTPLTVECGRFLKVMLQRNVRLGELHLWHCGLGADGLRLVCEGAGANEHLVCLSFRDPDVAVPPGAVVAAVQPQSKLAQLVVRAGSWSSEAFAELVSALRVNPTVSYVSVGQQDEFPDARLVQDLLRTYNYTLKSICLDHMADRGGYGVVQNEDLIGALLRRNQRVRCAANKLEIADYHVPCRPLWPLALHEISRFPTLLFRFIRKGNLTDLVLQLEHKSKLKKRRRDRAAEPDS